MTRRNLIICVCSLGLLLLAVIAGQAIADLGTGGVLREMANGEHYGTVLDNNLYWFTGSGAHLCRLNSDDDDTLADLRAKWAAAAYGTWNTGEDPPIGNDQTSVLADPLLAANAFTIPDHSPAAAAGYGGVDLGGYQRDRPAPIQRVRRLGTR